MKIKPFDIAVLYLTALLASLISSYSAYGQDVSPYIGRSVLRHSVESWRRVQFTEDDRASLEGTTSYSFIEEAKEEVLLFAVNAHYEYSRRYEYYSSLSPLTMSKKEESVLYGEYWFQRLFSSSADTAGFYSRLLRIVADHYKYQRYLEAGTLDNGKKPTTAERKSLEQNELAYRTIRARRTYPGTYHVGDDRPESCYFYWFDNRK